MSLAPKLPVGDTPDWETKDEEGEVSELLPPAESFAVYHSLRQSRNAWLNSVFPKFSTKAKGKHPAETKQPAPHTVRTLGKCDIEIGPLIFHDTTFFEIQYLPEKSQVQSGPALYQTSHATTSPYTSGQMSYGAGNYTSSATSSFPSSGSSRPSSSAASDPLLTSVESTVDVTPALIASVNEAASSNVTLQNLIQLVSAGQASKEQLQTLGVLIQTLAVKIQSEAMGYTAPLAPTSAGIQLQQPTKKSDLVIEFREKMNERLLIPHEVVACDQEVHSSFDDRRDVFLYTFVPFENAETLEKTSDVRPTSKSGAIIQLKNAPRTLWEFVFRWVSEDAKRPEARAVFLEKMNELPRVYPQFRLPQCDLLTQLQNSANNGCVMKLIKPSTSTDIAKPRRPRQRKPAIKAPVDTEPSTSATISAPTEQPGPDSTSKRALKRKRSTQKVPTEIACQTCGMTGVPLMRGGQICRACLDASSKDNVTASTANFKSGIFINTVAPQPDTGQAFSVATLHSQLQGNVTATQAASPIYEVQTMSLEPPS